MPAVTGIEKLAVVDELADCVIKIVKALVSSAAHDQPVGAVSPVAPLIVITAVHVFAPTVNVPAAAPPVVAEIEQPLVVNFVPLEINPVVSISDCAVPPMTPGEANVAPESDEALRLATLVVLVTTSGAVPMARVDVSCPVTLRLVPVAAPITGVTSVGLVIVQPDPKLGLGYVPAKHPPAAPAGATVPPSASIDCALACTAKSNAVRSVSVLIALSLR